ncbi:NAD(P)H dehydrogenase (quinone) [Salinisphaera dokdonensis CL-ES53]|uniref:NAD(P)H dehydrogenase (Quinone) n=1 Tax=Salinisphaera dokdonensis CL-ES53 TaxID=1304272 RepID=A0ABV2AZK7_9GAMM
MHALIVHCHPEPQSFNAALTRITRETLSAGGASVVISDLYAEGFDPFEGPSHYTARADADYFSALAEQRHAGNNDSRPADVKREIERLERADLVVLQFPLWWHAQPAMLKGWFDRVFVYGGLYTGRRRYDEGHFRGKRAMLSVTTGGPAHTFSPYGRGGPIERLLWPIHYSLHYMGFDVLPPFVAHGIQGGGIAYQDRAAFDAHLNDAKTRWAERLRRIDDSERIPFTGWRDWDDDGVLACEHPQRWLG